MQAAFGSAVAFVALWALLTVPAEAQDGEPATLGAQVVEIPDGYRQHAAYSGHGVFVVRVVPDSPAERAGIEPGDVITAVGAASLTSPAQYYATVSAGPAGTPLTIALARYGRNMSVTVSPVPAGELFAEPPTCRVAEADAATSDAIAAGRRRDASTEATSAARAFDLYESCAAGNARLDEHILIKAGDALLVQAAAAQGDRAAALPFARNAIAIYRLATRSAAVSAKTKNVAKTKFAALAAAFPGVAAGGVDESIALGLQTFSESQPANPFSVLGSWTTPANDQYRILHVRIDLHPQYEAHLFASGFKITIDTRDLGPTPVYALDSAPGPALGAAFKDKRDVDPREDFRTVKRADLGPGESKIYVLSFVIPNDSEYANAVAGIQYAPQ